MVYQECVTVREDDSEYHQNSHMEMSMEVRLKVIQLTSFGGAAPTQAIWINLDIVLWMCTSSCIIYTELMNVQGITITYPHSIWIARLPSICLSRVLFSNFYQVVRRCYSHQYSVSSTLIYYTIMYMYIPKTMQYANQLLLYMKNITIHKTMLIRK